MRYDAEQNERCIMLFARILRQAFDDLLALTSGSRMLSDTGRQMPPAEREETLIEVTSWFFDSTPSPCSLDTVCDILGLNPSWMGSRAKQIIAGSQAIQLRRRRLTAAQRTEICALLRSGATTAICARRFHVDQSTCRKARLREKRSAANLSASGAS
jgi:hypothetical protein